MSLWWQQVHTKDHQSAVMASGMVRTTKVVLIDTKVG